MKDAGAFPKPLLSSAQTIPLIVPLAEMLGVDPAPSHPPQPNASLVFDDGVVENSSVDRLDVHPCTEPPFPPSYKPLLKNAKLL